MRRLTLLIAPVLVLSIAGAQTEGPETAATKPLNKAEDIAIRIEKEVEKLRGLAFKEPVKIGVYDKATLKAFLLKLADKELKPERIEPYARGLKALALIPADMDFRKTMLDILNEQVAGFYDPETKELRLIDRSAGGDSAESKKTSSMEKMAKVMMERLGVDEDSVIMAHELTHALQDQHVGLKTLPMDVTDDDDLVVASQAVVEGDATLAMMGWMFQRMKMPASQLFSKRIASTLDQSLDLSSIPGADAVANAPAFIKESFIFPYVGGLKFCVTIASGPKSFVPVDQALKNPPLSTEQILHPEKYSGDASDFPMALVLPDLSEALGMQKVGSNTLGELFTRVLLAEKIDDRERTNAAAAGWDGDRYVVYGKAGAPDALVWVSTWDSEKEADELEAVLKSWLAPLNPGKTSEDSDVTSARFVRDDGTVDAIARKGADVILLRAVPKDRLIPVLQKVFEETKRTERKKV